MVGDTRLPYRYGQARRGEGKDLRRCFEIFECDGFGKSRRVIARTPLIRGEGPRQTELLEQGKADALGITMALCRAAAR